MPRASDYPSGDPTGAKLLGTDINGQVKNFPAEAIAPLQVFVQETEPASGTRPSIWFQTSDSGLARMFVDSGAAEE